MEQTKGPWVFYLKDYHWSILLTLSYALTITRDVLLLGQEQLFLCRIALRAKIYLTISGSIKGSFNRIRKIFLESRAFGPSGLYLLWSSRLLMHSYELDFASTIKNNKHLGFWSFFENLMNTRNTKKGSNIENGSSFWPRAMLKGPKRSYVVVVALVSLNTIFLTETFHTFNSLTFPFSIPFETFSIRGVNQKIQFSFLLFSI